MRLREKELKIRLTEAEYEDLSKTAKDLGLSRQALIIGAINNAIIIPAEELRELNFRFAECNRQLRGLATNINQMAHIANIYHKDTIKKLPEEQILLDISLQIKDFREECEKVWQSIRSLVSLQRNTEG